MSTRQNRMLDELGLAWNTNHTGRTLPSGKPLARRWRWWGESGCGKTTAGLCIVRSEEPTGGRIWYTPEPGAPPRDVAKMQGDALRALRRAVRVVFQDPFASLNARMTVLRIVGEPLDPTTTWRAPGPSSRSGWRRC